MPSRPATATASLRLIGSDRAPLSHQADRALSWRTRAKAALRAKVSPLPSPGSMASSAPQARTYGPVHSAGGKSRSEVLPLQPTILVAHADEDSLGSICVQLRREGFTVIPVESGEEALARVRSVQPALALLDLALPAISGLDVCRTIKTDPLTSEIQIILISNEDNEIDRVVGFEIGADDYVRTPCNLRELALRVRAVLRRTLGWQERKVAAVGPIVINHTQCLVAVNGRRIHVTATEYRLLALLAGRAGIVQSRDTLLCEVWGDETAIDSRSIDTYLRRLRAKLGDAACHLETVRGLGYRLAA